MSVTIQERIELTTMQCGCGITFSIPEYYRKEKQENGETWYCPNGHPRIYRKTDVEKAREERDEALRKLSAAKCEIATEVNRRIIAERDLMRHKMRAKNGICPCCHRSFQNLKRHINSKHPHFADDGTKAK